MAKAKGIILYDFYNSKAYRFPSLRKAAAFLGVPSGNVTTVAQGKSKYLVLREQYTVFYQNQYELNTVQDKIKHIMKGSRQRTIEANDLLTGKTYTFKGSRAASRKLGVDHSNIVKCLTHKIDECKGYTFNFKYHIQFPDKLPTLERKA